MRVLIMAAMAVTLAAPAGATIVIYSTPGAVQPAENVLFNNVPAPVGNNAFGRTNQTNAGVTFTSDEALVTPAQGAARLEGADGGLNDLSFALTDADTGFTEVEFNINGTVGDEVTLNFLDNMGATFSDTFTLVNGQNVFSARAFDDQVIASVNFTTTGDFADIRQVRLGGFADLGGGGGSPNPVPEPGTWALLLAGFAMVGHAARRRRAGLVA